MRLFCPVSQLLALRNLTTLIPSFSCSSVKLGSLEITFDRQIHLFVSFVLCFPWVYYLLRSAYVTLFGLRDVINECPVSFFQLCGQFLRQGKRRKLTTQDVERAMKWYNAEPVYGHGAGSNEPGYTRIIESSGKIGSGNVPMFVPDEKLIDLRPYALMQSPAILASMSTIQGN